MSLRSERDIIIAAVNSNPVTTDEAWKATNGWDDLLAEVAALRADLKEANQAAEQQMKRAAIAEADALRSREAFEGCAEQHEATEAELARVRTDRDALAEALRTLANELAITARGALGERIDTNLNEAMVSECQRAGRVLDWIGVAGGLPLSERVKWLAVELARKQGYTLDKAEELANRATGENLDHRAALAREERLTKAHAMLRSDLRQISETTPHKQGCDQPDDVMCARCVAEAGLASDADLLFPAPLPCGHPFSAVVSADEGTSYCGECATGLAEETT